MDPNELRRKAADKAKEAREILEAAKENGLTPEQREKHAQLLQEAEALIQDARAIEAQESIDGVLSGSQGRVGSDPDPGGDPPDPRDAQWRNFGEFMHAIRFNQSDERLRWMPADGGEGRAMSAGTGSEGGFLVPPQFRDEILQIQPQDAIFRPRATVIPAGDPADASITIPALDQSSTKGVYSGVRVKWTGEKRGTQAAGQPSLRDVTVEPREVSGFIEMTNKLLRNAPAAGALSQTLLRRAILASEDFEFLRGDGVGKPLGIIGHPAAVRVNRAIANEVAYEDVVAMYAAYLFGGRTIWTGSQTLLPQLMTMTDPAGNLIWQPNARDGAPGTLLGIPFMLNERNPVLGSNGDLTLMDPQYYIVKDGTALMISASEHAKFVENITILKALWNVDGQPWLTTPLTLEDGSTQVSPFVTLDVPAA